jgi:hypothetical protein
VRENVSGVPSVTIAGDGNGINNFTGMKKRTGILVLFLLMSFSGLFAFQPEIYPNLIPYRKGLLWGYCDSLKNIIVPPVYSEVNILSSNLLQGIHTGIVTPQNPDPPGYYDLYNRQGKKLMTLQGMGDFEKGYATIYENNFSGIIDTNGRIIIPPKYRGISPGPDEGLFICAIDNMSDKGCAVIDTSGALIFQLDSGSVSRFYHGLAWVTGRTSLGTVDRKGKVKWLMLNKKYQFGGRDIPGFMKYNTTDPSGVGLINMEGKIIIAPNGYWDIDWFNGLILVRKNNDRYGLYDTTGKVILPPDYEKIESARQQENLSGQYLYERTWRKFFLVKRNNLYGLIDSTGFEILPAAYNVIGPINDNVFWAIKDRKYYYYDIHGKALTPQGFAQAGDFDDGMSWVKEDNKYRLVGTDGKFLTDISYDWVNTNYNIHHDSVLSVSINKKYGLVNASGKTVVPLEYDFIMSYDGRTVMAEKDSLWGILDLHGNVLVPLKYKWLNYFSGGYAWANRDGINVIVDSAGHETIPPNTCEVRKGDAHFVDGYSEVIINGKQTLVNTNGQVPPSWFKYDYVRAYKDWFLVSKNKKCGVLDAHEQEILPLKYDGYIRKVGPSLFSVRLNGKAGYAGRNGIEYFED